MNIVNLGEVNKLVRKRTELHDMLSTTPGYWDLTIRGRGKATEIEEDVAKELIASILYGVDEKLRELGVEV